MDFPLEAYSSDTASPVLVLLCFEACGLFSDIEPPLLTVVSVTDSKIQSLKT